MSLAKRVGYETLNEFRTEVAYQVKIIYFEYKPPEVSENNFQKLATFLDLKINSLDLN